MAEATHLAQARARVSFEDRLLAEAVRAEEDALAAIQAGPQAEAIAIEANGDFERRLVTRAAALHGADDRRSALRHVRHAIGWIVAIGLVLAVLTGAATVRAALGPGRDEPVNVYLALLAILAAQTAALLLWIITMIVLPRIVSGGLLGAAAIAAGTSLVRRIHRGDVKHIAAVQAVAAALARGPLGRWTLSSITHAVWLAFNVGCLTAGLALLSTRDYTFVWETTILSDDAYVELTRRLAALPELAGFETPTRGQIAASRWIGHASSDPAAERAWSQFLLGSIVAYGLAPRAMLLLISLALRTRALRRYRLDTNQPGYLRLEPRLMPHSQSLGVVDADAGAMNELGIARTIAPARPPGPPAIIGLEIDRPATPWPPRVINVSWTDLGFVDDRESRRRVLAEIEHASHEPSPLVMVCSLTTTPDRGVGRFLAAVRARVRESPVLVLSGGEAMRRRGESPRRPQLSQRIDDWGRLSAAAGLDSSRVIELDLDHLTEASVAKLAAAITREGAPERLGDPGRRIEQAFHFIVEFAASWTPARAAQDQAALHRRIAELYRNERLSWQRLVDLRGAIDLNDPAAMAKQLRSSAARVVDLLPESLRISPRWLAAGAAAGALGCIAASALVSPIAIGSLPLWSGIGAAVAGFLRGQSRASEQSPEQTADQQFDTTIRAAALFAVLLELQGRDERSITRALDFVFSQDASTESLLQPGDAVAAATLRGWLDATRHRLDLALARERPA